MSNSIFHDLKIYFSSNSKFLNTRVKYDTNYGPKTMSTCEGLDENRDTNQLITDRKLTCKVSARRHS